jgi:hypothetical protein
VIAIYLRKRFRGVNGLGRRYLETL